MSSLPNDIVIVRREPTHANSATTTKNALSNSTRVDVLSGETLALLYSADSSGINKGNMTQVAWSLDGTMLYATAGFGWIDMKNNLNVGSGKGGNFKSSSWQPAIVLGGGLEQMVDDNFSIAGQVLYARTDTVAALPQDISYFSSDLPVYYTNNVVLATVNFIWHMN